MCVRVVESSVFVLFCDIKYRMVVVVATVTSANETMRTKKRERERKTSNNVHKPDKINVLIITGEIIELN